MVTFIGNLLQKRKRKKERKKSNYFCSRHFGSESSCHLIRYIYDLDLKQLDVCSQTDGHMDRRFSKTTRRIRRANPLPTHLQRVMQIISQFQRLKCHFSSSPTRDSRTLSLVFYTRLTKLHQCHFSWLLKTGTGTHT